MSGFLTPLGVEIKGKDSALIPYSPTPQQED